MMPELAPDGDVDLKAVNMNGERGKMPRRGGGWRRRS